MARVASVPRGAPLLKSAISTLSSPIATLSMRPAKGVGAGPAGVKFAAIADLRPRMRAE